MELTVLPPGIPSIVGVGLVPSWGLQPHGEGFLAGEWRGFPWKPFVLSDLKAQGRLLLCFAILSRPALPSVVHMMPLGLVHPSGFRPESFVASPLFSHPGLGSLPCLKVLGALVEPSRANEPDFAVFVCLFSTDLPPDPTAHLLLWRKSDSQESCLPLVPVQVSNSFLTA